MTVRAPKLAEWAAAKDPVIRSITADSRLVSPGTLFVALPGVANDGRRFIADAIGRGAAAVVTDAEGAAAHLHAAVPVVVDQNPRQLLALVAARFYGAQPKTVAAVTGTNGKTSTASFTRQIWADAGHRAASIGTLGIEGPNGLEPGAMTTPDPVALHRALSQLAADGIDHAVLEASSHGLDQYRLDGVRITAGAFTNLTQDHLDYHKTMAAYLAAKLRLFEHVLAPGATAVLNADIPEYAEAAAVARAAGHPIIEFGAAATALRLVDRASVPAGQRLELEVLGRRRTVELPLVGTFQAMNALAALGLAIATGVEPDRAIDALTRLKGVRGRVEHVATLANGASVFVDYAHTPDGLEKILTALRSHATGRLIVAFGAGGDRDPTKRPRMGEVCARLADLPIVTDDNPRSEEPAAIRRAILAACPDAIEIGDRAAAIDHGIGLLGPGDVFVIAGKGHEQGQTVAGVVHPFDDATVARAAIDARGLKR
ncbi:UDP-N-acetylmuramoyl-L-alanyl-D-glutamate--2,6-diaminopimelate ligase [Aliidongia dinghuensis]|uniref:UDP-N-acetylmuramoyl-L-alanyl-D-glutamate--2,6-diaminopimelate ligase n=1 Tax=Aliidongia dinghuensis TaxID=1867774 RepID=A0A8J3E4V6_9PROT|nr:UDP-N-acetylmuramoyl-L-alanyl-D-glutamate--2,6-diaminopimelate ligase [Aliidongia dinghuensis]GGF17481.1 UDP-N-acetylmuramoyl-L-alanyl-D-glutamate--2,6-diaminopimelate ligase [Aliidongia dinghuensis]